MLENMSWMINVIMVLKQFLDFLMNATKKDIAKLMEAEICISKNCFWKAFPPNYESV